MLLLRRGTGLKRLIAALQTDDTAILQSNITKRDSLPPSCRRGENADTFRRRSPAE
jgi:hypothetical protein